MKGETLYVGPDGRLRREPPSERPSADIRESAQTPTSAAARLTEKLTALCGRQSKRHPRNERSEYERDVYEILRDAELGRLAESRFCPVCRSETVLSEDDEWDECDALGCEVCGYRGALSTFNVY